MTEGLIDDDQGDFRSGRECIDKIFTQSQISKKVREKKRRVYVGFMSLENACAKVNMETL